jgi:SAM-dependent methyltransferase
MAETPLRSVLAGDPAVADELFDRIYAPPLARISRLHWTPVAVAKRAAQLLGCDAGQTVLDVGGGAGKFCIVGALTSQARFVGVETRDYLVQVGRAIIQGHGVDRVELVHADVLQVDWSGFDGIYLFNPFCEAPPQELAVRRAERRLWQARSGTRVVTYHGFGGTMPSGYRLLAREPAGTNQLELWQRAADPAA